jgi:flagellar basal body-associated protein FliL
MGFIEKLEKLINGFLFRLVELMWLRTPESIQVYIHKLKIRRIRYRARLKALPSELKLLQKNIQEKIKVTLGSIDWKGIFLERFNRVRAFFKGQGGQKSGFKKFIHAPVGLVTNWLQGLSASQAMLLLTFTGGSVLAVIGMSFSGQKLLNLNSNNTREPASVITYDRPNYYKKQTKHFEVNNFRLPVYVANVNEIRSVDIDFTATTSNRYSKMFLEKNELQLRDHLILQIEPSIASFPIEDEGKEIIRKKLLEEINAFLKTYEVEGEVVELKITYVLAN